MQLSGKRLQVWHFPQVPCPAFTVDVKDEYEAMKMINTLADQHCWLFKNKIIPDYSSNLTVVMWEDGQWVDYYNKAEDMDWDEFEEAYEDQLTY